MASRRLRGPLSGHPADAGATEQRYVREAVKWRLLDYTPVPTIIASNSRFTLTLKPVSTW